MIVTCERCSTQFRLDDARVPERGARVRCSRCKHAFFVKPEAPAGDRIESAVERALDQQTSGRDPGETAPDLPDLDDGGDFDATGDLDDAGPRADADGAGTSAAAGASGELHPAGLDAGGDVDIAGRSASGHLDTADPGASVDVDTADLDAGGDSDTGDLEESGDLAAGGDLDAGDVDPRGGFDAADLGASGDLDTGDLGAEAGLDADLDSGDLGAEAGLDGGDLDATDDFGNDLDLAGSDGGGDGEAAGYPGGAAVLGGEVARDGRDALADSGPLGDESDWEFNHETQAPPSRSADAAQEAIDDLLGRPAAAAASPAAERTPLGDADAEAGPAAAAAPAELETEDVFGEPGVFDASAGPEEALEADAGGDADGWDDSGLDVDALGSEDAATPDALGTPDEWDFFDGEPGEAGSAAAGSRGGTAPSDALLLSANRVRVDASAEGSRLGRATGRTVDALGWAIVAGLTLLALHGSLGTPAWEAPAAAPLKPLPDVEVVDFEGRWVENAVAGPLFVVSGRVRSAKAGRVVPGAWLAVRLFDGQGALLADQAGALGPPLPRTRVREENPRDLRAIQASGALAMAWSALEPGDGLPLQAILSDVPDGARRFDVVAVPAQETTPVPQSLAPSPDAG